MVVHRHEVVDVVGARLRWVRRVRSPGATVRAIFKIGEDTP